MIARLESFGPYLLVERLGRGRTGEVFRAYDTSAKRTVALKRVPAWIISDQSRFRRSVAATASLSDPHVLPIRGFGEIDGWLYIDMALIEGRDLRTLLAKGPLNPARAVRIVEQVASALDAAHRVGLLHLDVKPSNVLVAGGDVAYLTDFAIAATLERDDDALPTPEPYVYMAPERLTHGQSHAAADVYALACVLYECLTGFAPFGRDDHAKIISRHMFTPPPQPTKLRRGLPALFDGVIAKGMAKDPGEPYKSATELADAARAALEGARNAQP